ncbi:stearoyl-CoA desaturase 5 [Scaptodrosophila lebanonensis]|uniref:Stearoyl-CoA desaturase 5 n=1 Tax=Drosophila lebanonensis TaxID=7225 RepID=A0A6J2T2J5_DROLE|nr:stearoyl-CoA desaturase 5 [Scaptodrosophila lebanonensis]
MAPNIIGSTFILAETAIADANNNKMAAPPASSVKQSAVKKVAVAAAPAAKPAEKTDAKSAAQAEKPYQMEIVWHNVLLFIILHSFALYGLFLIFAESAYMELFVIYFTTFLGGLGITAGVHRLWSHKAYKAKLPLRIFLMLCQSLAFQNCIWEWTRDHRVHHKFTDTHADPHNSRRGFFFAHMGWLMCKKHPDVTSKGKQIDMTDIEQDPVVMFQKKYYFFVMPICCFVLPMLFPYYMMGSSLRVCFFSCSMLRYAISLHGTWLVNSAAHFYGMKPYDVNVSAVNTKVVSTITFGEGWHNYHHVFPWDYKAAELGTYNYNWTTAFIDMMAKIGQAYDLKSVSQEMVYKRVLRTGDGSHIAALLDANNNTTAAPTNELVMHLDHDKEDNAIWGWDDKDISEEDRKGANIVNNVTERKLE